MSNRCRPVPIQMISNVVLFDELRADNGARIGRARLNSEQTLNALTLEMIDLMSERFTAWAADPEVALVVLEGAGEKAFCAGGDLHALRDSILEHRASARRDDIRANAYALAFFSREYRLDYLIHTYPKPVLAWGHGIVMGGGLGLMGGASHRVVTERSRIAMPEISIGLYPDVGGSWLLARMPGRLGLFLALTGAPLNAADALFAGAADYAIRQSDKALVFDRLRRRPWTASRAENDRHLAGLLDASALTDGMAAPARANFELIDELCRHATVSSIAAAIAGAAQRDSWLERAASTLAAGSPSSAALSHALQQRARDLSLADVFRIELVASLNCAARPDFAEGIRALLIDKDRKPRWSPATLAEVTQEWVEGYFASPWPPGEHPLADLGA
jgi:enoyl-CoA hydratase/carnithine racemase